MKRTLVFMGLLLVLACIIAAGYDRAKISMTVEKDVMHLLDVRDCGVYVLSEDNNRMTCDLTTFSYLVCRMQADGYILSGKEEAAGYIEVCLSRDGTAVRLHYDSGGNFTSICKLYEKSYLPLTYLNDE